MKESRGNRSRNAACRKVRLGCRSRTNEGTHRRVEGTLYALSRLFISCRVSYIIIFVAIIVSQLSIYSSGIFTEEILAKEGKNKRFVEILQS